MGNFIGSYKLVEVIPEAVTDTTNQTVEILKRFIVLYPAELNNGSLAVNLSINKVDGLQDMLRAAYVMFREDPSLAGSLVGPSISKIYKTFAVANENLSFIRRTQEIVVAGEVHTYDTVQSDWIKKQVWILENPETVSCIQTIGDGRVVFISSKGISTQYNIPGTVELRKKLIKHKDYLIIKEFLDNRLLQTEVFMKNEILDISSELDDPATHATVKKDEDLSDCGTLRSIRIRNTL